MKNTLPATMKALFQESKGAELVVKETSIPEPLDGEVLVKMHFSPINPSDLSQLRATFTPGPNYPFIPGIEGSGTVVSSGKGLIPALRKGKMVACSPKGKGGTWAEYMLTDATKCIPLGKDISPEKGAMLIVNPMTALALTDIAKKGNYTSMVNNAASSSLGLMLINLCEKYQINLINIVRKEGDIKYLNEQGAKYVLNSSDNDFESDFRKLIAEMDTKLFFDAVGEKQTSTFIEASPRGSRIILYANLSNTSFTADPRDILQHGKSLEGFSLPLWLSDKSIFQLLKHTARVKKFISENKSKSFRAKYSMQEVNKALKEYKENMTGGKVLLEL